MEDALPMTAVPESVAGVVGCCIVLNAKKAVVTELAEKEEDILKLSVMLFDEW